MSATAKCPKLGCFGRMEHIGLDSRGRMLFYCKICHHQYALAWEDITDAEGRSRFATANPFNESVKN